jgi:multidrug efflux pump
MRVWLDPQKVAEHGLTPSDVVRDPRPERPGRGRRDRRLAGEVGARLPALGQRAGAPRQRGGVRQHRRQDGPDGARRACATFPASSSAPPTTRCARCSTTSRPSRSAIFQAPELQRARPRDRVIKTMRELKQEHARGRRLHDRLRPDGVRPRLRSAVITTLLEAIVLVVLVVILFLQTWRASIIPLHGVPVSVSAPSR